MPADPLTVYGPFVLPTLVLLAGVIFALIRWQEHLMASLAVVVGCFLLLFVLWGGRFIETQFLFGPRNFNTAMTVSRIWYWARMFLSSLAYACLILGALRFPSQFFSKGPAKAEPPPRRRKDDEEPEGQDDRDRSRRG